MYNQNLNWLNALQQNNQQQGYKGRIPRVHGKGGVDAFRMEPDSSVFLADETEDNVIWLKSTDSAGFAIATKGHVTFEEEAPQNPDSYVSKDEFNELKTKVDKLLEDLK